MRLRLAIVVALASLGCRSRRGQETSDATVAPTPPTQLAPTASSAVARVSASPSASAAPTHPPDCKLHLQPVGFIEANPHPSQRDYPEVWTYDVAPVAEPATEAGGCLPAHVTLGISGWQAISDLLRARVGYDPTRPHEATLTLERVESSILGFRTPPGTLLATLVFYDTGVREFHFGPGIASRTHVRSLPAQAPF